MCTTCGSTIAEYREFQKQNQQADVGLAKPISPSSDQPVISNESTIQPSTQPEIQTFSAPSDPQGSFSSIVGMSVYSADAKRVGVAKQVGVNSSHQVVLIVTKNNGSDETIEWGKIKKIGEIILLGDGSQSATSSLKCSGCSYENKAGSKFCESCGSKL
jgi:sporulation protein YlmC with PRC-barrel domain